ncbi:hypothetical protein P700755_003952 [Psychroflexus torquis ATCC 700755]|uniref:Transmembrane protein n=1 Tax=Psychroflexus torquis (strain ATCC 700755 / CIP 106069 / ACAM 623) TaxID=313595 RepID=K4IL75_PSYTT|nr:hypothetical protein [Psychroflexus torquis]AFU70523.1 hypothetical protein P700755_003952 [Psychroflexus torquis ATCC 700755]
MDYSIIIGIIGIVITLVFGFLSFDLFKRKKYPGKITYVKLSLIDLLNNVANNFKEIKLLHNNSPIKKNIIYIKGALLNNGDIDINGQLIEKDISAQLPDNCKWLDVKATEFSEGLSVDIIISRDNKAIFKFDLFRKSEFVQFEGLIEVKEEEISADNIESEIVFSHRIENTSKIEKKNLLTKKELKKKKEYALLCSILFLLSLLVVASTFIFNLFGTKLETVYFINNTNVNELYQIKLQDSLVELNSMSTNKDVFTVTLDEFNMSYKASEKQLTFRQRSKEFYWIFFIQFCIFLIIVLWELSETHKAKRLSMILAK